MAEGQRVRGQLRDQEKERAKTDADAWVPLPA